MPAQYGEARKGYVVSKGEEHGPIMAEVLHVFCRNLVCAAWQASVRQAAGQSPQCYVLS